MARDNGGGGTPGPRIYRFSAQRMLVNKGRQAWGGVIGHLAM